jgi:hypothetical protein
MRIEHSAKNPQHRTGHRVARDFWTVFQMPLEGKLRERYPYKEDCMRRPSFKRRLVFTIEKVNASVLTNPEKHTEQQSWLFRQKSWPKLLVLVLQSVAFLKLNVAFMDAFDIQMHVSWYHALDRKHVRILVKFERMLSISVLRNKSFFTKKRGLSHLFGKRFVSLFSSELYGQSAFKFDKNTDVLRTRCMLPRRPGFLGWVHFFRTHHSNRSLF